MKKRHVVLSIFLLALALRLFLVPNRGFEADIAFWKSWGLSALDNGVVEGIAVTNNNYPTPFSYLLALLAFAYRLFANPHIFDSYWNSGNVLFLLIAKLPSILADLGIAGLILWIGRNTKRIGFPYLSSAFCLLLSCLYLFNPVSLIDGALWGQVDSLGVFVFFLAVLCAASDKPVLGGAIFMLSMMTKLQNMIYGPLFFLLLWQLGSFKGLIKGIVGAVSAFFILNIEFLLKKNMGAVMESLTSNYDYFPLMSLNAFNLWWVVAKGAGMQVSDKLLSVGIINAKTTGLILFSTGYLLAVMTMMKETLKNMWKPSAISRQLSDKYEKNFEDNTSDPSTPLRTIARGEWKKFRSSLPELSKWNAIAKHTIASSGTRNFFCEQKREKDGDKECGARTSDGEKRATTDDFFYNQQRSSILFRFFTALIIVCFSFFLFQTESHDRYAFPVSIFMLIWGLFYVYRTNTEKMRMLWWKTRSFQIFIIEYVMFSLLFFLNLHTALSYNYPYNSIPALLFLRSPIYTILISLFQIAFFFFFLYVARKTIGSVSFSLCFLFSVFCFLFLNISLITKSPVSLTKLTPHTSQQGYGSRVTNMPVNAGGASKNWDRLSVQYSFYKKGIGTHASSYIVYDLAGVFKRFTADVGIDTEAGSKGSVVFKLYGDDKLLYQSDIIKRFEYPRHIDIDITGVKTFALIVDDGGDGITDDHADWLNPTLWPK
jgi:hypothetical protein